jgi:uncharacterized protein YecE (DUF72 family)
MPAASADLFDFTPVATDSRIRVGIGGWNFAPWRKNFYPDGLPQRRELEYASRRLNAIEINSTFYGAQKPATYARWAAETPPGFVFSLKAPRYVVETRQLAQASKGVHGFLEGGIAEMGDRLGPIVWQLAPRRAFDAGDLEPFLADLPRTLNGRPLRHVLEVRHRSFLSPAYVELARSQQIATVFTDSPDYPSLADLTGAFVYARLMHSDSAQPEGYRADALDEWATRAQRWADGGDIPDLPHVLPAQPAGKPREVFVFFIGAAKPHNPAAAQALLARLQG